MHKMNGLLCDQSIITRAPLRDKTVMERAYKVIQKRPNALVNFRDRDNESLIQDRINIPRHKNLGYHLPNVMTHSIPVSSVKNRLEAIRTKGCTRTHREQSNLHFIKTNRLQ
ncbi:hypothetical protein GLYMA_10G187600v4 [Glycine max]|uniref:Uncharacterized protein n=1 Tax=Glycine max TaxID=3847 RepID=A0A0R0HVB8_SOYBN|nr:hypothetical protein GYH30_028581 [Glycine max]KRH34493.1 hypothetical protein GLYMA_10G187600v4 [Glycine max]